MKKIKGSIKLVSRLGFFKDSRRRYSWYIALFPEECSPNSPIKIVPNNNAEEKLMTEEEAIAEGKKFMKILGIKATS